MKWEDFKPFTPPVINGYQLTGIECPKCGEKLHKNIDIILTSLPPKNKYKCFNCKWIGYK